MAAPVTPGPCPECGGQVQRVRQEDGGAIEETVIGRGCQLRRVVRPASYWACAACEWAAEMAPSTWQT